MNDRRSQKAWHGKGSGGCAVSLVTAHVLAGCQGAESRKGVWNQREGEDSGGVMNSPHQLEFH